MSRGAARVVASIVGVVAIAVAVLPAAVAGATTAAVTNCNGSGAGSLPAVVGSAAAGTTVTFSVSCSGTKPIVLSQPVSITGDISIAGPGARSMVVSGGGTTDVFDVAGGATAAISGLTVENGGDNYDGGGIYNNGTLTVDDVTLSGNSTGIGIGGAISNVGGTLTVSDSSLFGDNTLDLGGGIFNDVESTATVSDSTLWSDSADGGGGIYNEGTMVINDSTLSSNSAGTDDGGGILNEGTLDVVASTFSGNAAEDGAGIFNGASATVAASVVATSYGSADCGGTITDAGYNLDDDGSCGFSAVNHSQSDVDADLASLADNGGPTPTQAPAAGSPLLDRIPAGATADGVTLCPGTDQRGVARPQGPACDIGAVELTSTPEAITSADSASTPAGAGFSFTVTTSGIPIPTISETGRLPRQLSFTDNGKGTATLSGIPGRRGVHHLTITATFGAGTSAPVLTQAFTLTVTKH
jgi:hypothetical protein